MLPVLEGSGIAEPKKFGILIGLPQFVSAPKLYLTVGAILILEDFTDSLAVFGSGIMKPITQNAFSCAIFQFVFSSLQESQNPKRVAMLG